MYSPQLPAARARVFFPSQTEKPNVETGTLEASLLQLISDHHHTSLRLREHTGADTGYVIFQTEKAKKDAIIAAMRVSDLLVDTVNGGVQESFVNEKRIELEIRALTATIARSNLATRSSEGTKVPHFHHGTGEVCVERCRTGAVSGDLRVCRTAAEELLVGVQQALAVK
ncbi:hypothetical protein RJ640_025194 [Escallonia rubra]|uniref:Biogenesis of lysosome-related organelles complex 1 subunit 1 n=1 Tax=Escallonia rubra TaxID=112253 RepID=A0AA88RAU1_9ASTE|nr:hypothetical protein RJ640_025194 [Escallonia rubra]